VNDFSVHVWCIGRAGGRWQYEDARHPAERISYPPLGAATPDEADKKSALRIDTAPSPQSRAPPNG
jgi:hypothetical protein